MWYVKKFGELIGEIGAICPDSLFQKTQISTPKKRNVQPGDAFEDTTFKPGFENVKC